MDASTGISKDAWSVQLYGQNLTDTRANLYSSYGIRQVRADQPAAHPGLRFSYKFDKQ